MCFSPDVCTHHHFPRHCVLSCPRCVTCVSARPGSWTWDQPAEGFGGVERRVLLGRRPLWVSLLQFRLSWLFEKKRIRARSQNFLRSTMASSSKKTCVRGRWAELVDFYYFHVQSAAAHMMHIKVYARTSTQTNASLLSNCRPPTARVHGGQARTRRTLSWRKHEARASARAYIRILGRPRCGLGHRQTAC